MDAIRMTMRRLLADTSGATAIEYGLLAAMIALAIISSVTSVGGAVGGSFDNVTAEFQKI